MSMKNGTCPECGSNDVRYDRGSYSETIYTRANNIIMIHKPGLMGMNVERAYLDTYACVTCGYVRSFVADRQNLDTIAKHWPRVVEDAQEDTRAEG